MTAALFFSAQRLLLGIGAAFVRKSYTPRTWILVLWKQTSRKEAVFSTKYEENGMGDVKYRVVVEMFAKTAFCFVSFWSAILGKMMKTKR